MEAAKPKRPPTLKFGAALSRRYGSPHRCIGVLRCEMSHSSHVAVYTCTAVRDGMLLFAEDEPRFSELG